MYSLKNCEAEQITTATAAESGDSAAWLFPGLGSRYVGMGADIMGQEPLADELLSIGNQLVGYDVAAVCLTGSGRKHVPARVEAQVIFIVNCAYATVLTDQGITPSVVSGHSLGTWAAAYAAGVVDFQTGLQLVTLVEDLLEEMPPTISQGMGVVIGLPEEAVRELCSTAGDVFLANCNSPGQYVISGVESKVESVLKNAISAGAHKAKRIAGNTAMHSPLLAKMNKRLRNELSFFPIADAAVPLVNNSRGGLLSSRRDILDYLGEFLVLPVDWERSTQRLIKDGTKSFLEVGAGGILTGMMPFIDRVVAAETASDRLSSIRASLEISPSEMSPNG